MFFWLISVELPKNWAPMDERERFKMVQLSSSDAEYIEVKKAFESTVNNLRISKVSRTSSIVCNWCNRRLGAALHKSLPAFLYVQGHHFPKKKSGGAVSKSL